MVAVKDRKNALKNPYAHLKLPDIDLEMVRDSPMVWEPVRRLESLPGVRRRLRHGPHRRGRRRRGDQAGRRGSTAPPIRSELGQFPGRDPVNPQGRPGLRRRRLPPGRHHRTRSRTSTSSSATCRSAGTSRCGWRTSGFAGAGEGWKLTEDGETEIGGELPVNASGGVLSSNPIGASGMLRFAEAALQVRGQAGEHQVDGVRTAVGHAYGGAAQFFAMWVLQGHEAVSRASHGRDARRPAPARRARRARARAHHEPARAPQRAVPLDDAGDERGVGRGQRQPRHPRGDPHRGGRVLLRRRRPRGDDRVAPRRRLPAGRASESTSGIAAGVIKPLLKGFLLDKPLIAAVEGAGGRRRHRDPPGHRHPHRR